MIEVATLARSYRDKLINVIKYLVTVVACGRLNQFGYTLSCSGWVDSNPHDPASNAILLLEVTK